MQSGITLSRHGLWILTVLLALAVTTSVPATASEGVVVSDDARQPKTVRLLTVGNSFSGNATQFLAKLAAADGNVLIHRQAAIGGASLEQHWEKARRHEKDPADPLGLYGNKRGLREELRAERWDVITIQQASILSHDLSTYRPYARQLFDEIKRLAPQAEVLVHQTWAYRRDDPRFAAKVPQPGAPADQEAMYQGLTNAYAAIAAELGTRVIPVGNAFHRADTNPDWGYRPDETFAFKTAQRPQLPDQTHSLHMGWQWLRQKDGTYALRMDGHHASPAGRYLGSCVFYDVLFGETVVGNRFVPPGIDAGYAKFLQETAHQAVAQSRTPGPSAGAPAPSPKP